MYESYLINDCTCSYDGTFSLTEPNIKGIKLEKSTLEERIEYLEQRLKETRNQIKQKVLVSLLFIASV